MGRSSHSAELIGRRLVQPEQASDLGVPTTSRQGRPSFICEFARNRAAVVGVLVLSVIVGAAVFGPHMTPYDPLAATPYGQLLPPSQAHPFGTDELGRDVLARMVYGASLTLQVGFIAVGIAVTIGILLGLPAGYFGGWVDMLVMRAVDVLLAFPAVLLALSIVSLLGASLRNAMVAIGISVIPVYVRLVRASVLSAREQPYVEAARVVGVRHIQIMFGHILPNILAPVVVVATLGVGGAIIVGAALSFLGLGAQPPQPEWGAMVTIGSQYIQIAWWMSVFPGVAISATVLAINLVGDGLRDALDPRLTA